MKKRLAIVLVLVSLVFGPIGCKNEKKAAHDQASSSESHSNSTPEYQRVSAEEADFKILFFGNSHTTAYNIPKRVEQLLNRRLKNKKVHCAFQMGGFLEQLASAPFCIETIENGNWDLIVLQGQKISMSGDWLYPTDGAEKIAMMAKENGATALLYCEWGRHRREGENDPGKIDEAERTQKVYESIAAKTGAKIVPVGLVWEEAFKEHPGWVLHAEDGNHCNRNGAFLTSLVFEKLILENYFDSEEYQNLDLFEPVKDIQVDEEMQKQLATVANKHLHKLIK